MFIQALYCTEFIGRENLNSVFSFLLTIFEYCRIPKNSLVLLYLLYNNVVFEIHTRGVIIFVCCNKCRLTTQTYFHWVGNDKLSRRNIYAIRKREESFSIFAGIIHSNSCDRNTAH